MHHKARKMSKQQSLFMGWSEADVLHCAVLSVLPSGGCLCDEASISLQQPAVPMSHLHRFAQSMQQWHPVQHACAAALSPASVAVCTLRMYLIIATIHSCQQACNMCAVHCAAGCSGQAAAHCRVGKPLRCDSPGQVCRWACRTCPAAAALLQYIGAQLKHVEACPAVNQAFQL